MKKRILCAVITAVLLMTSACGSTTIEESTTASATTTTMVTTETTTESTTEQTTALDSSLKLLSPTSAIQKLESNFSVSSYSGDYYFEDFLKAGGASSDEDIVNFLVEKMLTDNLGKLINVMGSGCSTLAVKNTDGGRYFGRNFDWKKCNGLIMVSKPSKGYKSVSTVNTDFITSSLDFEIDDSILRIAALYCPLDGMNEKGVCVSVNMVNDSAKINQNTDKPDITTTTAIRLILNKAATTQEAIDLLKSYDMHGSFGYMIHFAITDTTGHSVVAEYINNKLVITETPVVTNFYLTPGEKYGIGSKQSVTRYEILQKALKENDEMTFEQVRDAMSSVSKKNFNEFESTEWTAVFDQKNLTVTYYHRENYTKGYRIVL